MATLLRSAVDILGSTVRDTRVLRDLFASSPEHATPLRHGVVVVALGALGEIVSPETVVRDTNDRAGVGTAWLVWFRAAVGILRHRAPPRTAARALPLSLSCGV